jgi:hypothetical protein
MDGGGVAELQDFFVRVAGKVSFTLPLTQKGAGAGQHAHNVIGDDR